MIHKTDDLIAIHCDDCEVEMAEAGHFDSAVEIAKTRGEVRPDGEGGWTHRCRSCAREARLAAHRDKFRL